MVCVARGAWYERYTVIVRLAARGCVFALVALAACSSNGSEPEPPLPRAWLDSPSMDLPETMSELGLYVELAGQVRVHEAVAAYRPSYELWSNGTTKDRFLFLPRGTSIDTSQRDAWVFPSGTILLKTFSAPRVTESGVTEAQPIETRLLHLLEDDWQYAVYLWDEAGNDATLAELDASHPVAVEIDGERFEHVVPAKLDCRKCHESQPSPVIGVDELRLAGSYEASGPSQLAWLHERGILSDLPAEPKRIVHDDLRTQRVLEYLAGNCTHCHNGGRGASSAFDLRHDVALENLVNRETEGESIAGIRVVPGDPESSALYLALSRLEGDDDVQAMPPIGVQRADASALELFRRWIEELKE